MDKLERIEQIERQLAELKEQVKAEEPKEFPQKDDFYWVINSDGRVCRTVWCNDKTDYRIKTLGNIYRTREEAEEAVRKRKAEVAYKNKIKEVNGDWKPDWSTCRMRKNNLELYLGNISVADHTVLQTLDNSEYFRPDITDEQLSELKRLYAAWKGIEE